MGEIKFRAWDKSDNVMCEVTFIKFSNVQYMNVSYRKKIDGKVIDENAVLDENQHGTCVLMQYTGLKDKNGVEIYEGDIFIFNDELWTSGYTSCGTEYDSCEADNYGVVGFDEDTLRFDFTRYKYNENQVEADLHENHEIEFADFIQEHEVIGNIYENPELLEGGEQ